MSSQFVIKKKPKESEAIIFSDDQEIAKIEKHDDFSFKLIRCSDKKEWALSNIVDGQRRPFSYTVRTVNYDKSNETSLDQQILVVREQLFEHKGKIYMLASHPEGKTWKDYVNSSTRYISRLDNIPFRNLSDVDHDHYTLRHKVKRLRGKPVGEASGLAQEEGGHRIHLDEELSDIGLFIAVISYLLYASG